MVHTNGRAGYFVVLTLSVIFLGSCALDSLAMDVLADTLSRPGSNTVFMGDDDVELVGDALPFAIKFYESIGAMRPEHQGMRLTIGSMYVMYANAYIQTPAQRLGPEEFEKRNQQLARAKKLYLRGRDMIQGVFAYKYPVFNQGFVSNDLGFVLASMTKDDVPCLYWFSAAWFSAASLDSLDTRLGVKLPLVKAMIDRALELDPGFNNGAIHELLMLYHASMPPGLGYDAALSEQHYLLALKVAGGSSASAMVGRAESWYLTQQDRAGFEDLLGRALLIDPNMDKNSTLVTVMAQDRARFLLGKLDELFW